MNTILSGIAIVTSLGVLISSAEASPSVRQQCQVPWAGENDFIGQPIILPPELYKAAEVIANPGEFRLSAGNDSPVVMRPISGTRVTVTGELWDNGCNHWAQVRMGDNVYWIDADQIVLR